MEYVKQRMSMRLSNARYSACERVGSYVGGAGVVPITLLGTPRTASWQTEIGAPVLRALLSGHPATLRNGLRLRGTARGRGP